ncbi:hypothetical protein Bbelb_019010 [Branchiostoma belcheri]|nr:hypothetical protein Bbelb_019010 [Branchiostoma belcheri]
MNHFQSERVTNNQHPKATVVESYRVLRRQKKRHNRKEWGQALKDIMGHEELSSALKKQVRTTILKDRKNMAPTSILGQSTCEDLKKFSIADVKKEIERGTMDTRNTSGYRSLAVQM